MQHYIPGNDYQLYLRVLSEGEWLGTRAPAQGTLNWLRPDGRVALFTLLDNDLTEDDEYEHFRAGTQVLCQLNPTGDWHAETGFHH